MGNSLYIHIPFCRQKCSYCDFYSVNYQKNLADTYIEIICQQISQLEIKFSTIYLGGGTPSVLESSLLIKLFKALKYNLSNILEFTIEVNPESVTKEKLQLCLDYGVNRISVGIQSFDQDKLKSLGRLHSTTQARDAVLLAKNIGFNNIGVDLIFGVEKESLSVWQKDLELAVSLPITHLSTYGLTYEKGTPLFLSKEKGQVSPLEDSLVAQMYEAAMDYLPKFGFIHYEISNFSKSGYPSQHNLNYWENNSYYGVGAGAVAYLGNSRIKNISDVEKYILGVLQNQNIIEAREQLSPIERAKETAVLGMRRAQGVLFEYFQKKTGYSFKELYSVGNRPACTLLLNQGLIEYIKNEKDEKIGMKLTRKGFLFSDTVSSAFL